ncbi:MAG: aminopeptidase P family protein [Limnochordaceae bacterium]|nr:aminopeptidase P family protein [Limnochordaceae bacterium]
MMQAQAAEWRGKWEQIRQLLAQEKLDGVVLATEPSIAWLTGGAQVYVARGELVASLLVTAESITILTNAIEAQRLEREEFAPVAATSGWKMNVRPWTESPAQQLSRVLQEEAGGKGHWLTDDPGLAWALSDPELGPTLRLDGQALAALRYALRPEEVERYREVGRLTAACLESAARSIRMGQTEAQIAAELDNRLQSAGLEPTVTLVAADQRISAFRHPVPTNTPVWSRCMLVTCARRYGLVTAATRLVQFDTPPADLVHRHQAVLQVEAAMLAASRPGRTLADVYQAAATAYAAQGYPGEERLHHQGGTIGYRNRELLATPDGSETLRSNQAVAWNPSITGTKTEDTFLITEAGWERVTRSEADWPQLRLQVDGQELLRPGILQLR